MFFGSGNFIFFSRKKNRFCRFRFIWIFLRALVFFPETPKKDTCHYLQGTHIWPLQNKNTNIGINFEKRYSQNKKHDPKIEKKQLCSQMVRGFQNHPKKILERFWHHLGVEIQFLRPPMGRNRCEITQISTEFTIFLGIWRFSPYYRRACTGAQKSKKSKISENELKHTQTIIEDHMEGFYVECNTLRYPKILPSKSKQNQTKVCP